MFCTKCGYELRDGDLFCGKCGTRIHGDSAQGHVNVPANGSENDYTGKKEKPASPLPQRRRLPGKGLRKDLKLPPRKKIGRTFTQSEFDRGMKISNSVNGMSFGEFTAAEALKDAGICYILYKGTQLEFPMISREYEGEKKFLVMSRVDFPNDDVAMTAGLGPDRARVKINYRMTEEEFKKELRTEKAIIRSRLKEKMRQNSKIRESDIDLITY